jgi:hypothetical protein
MRYVCFGSLVKEFSQTISDDPHHYLHVFKIEGQVWSSADLG